MDKYSEEYIKNREQQLVYKYGITLAEYDKMVEKQKGVCAICGLPETYSVTMGYARRLCIDHDHKTGKVRGLLCLKCNCRLAALDDKEFLEKALDYLKKHEN
ncbi:unnamed protein product [marine sediment metagenome]|uniref:Recombination endonuclease VII n=1 Tax=marine sediment metagenome TaxID=412755 RepID=X1HHJ1_9ZZZZ